MIQTAVTTPWPQATSPTRLLSLSASAIRSHCSGGSKAVGKSTTTYRGQSCWLVKWRLTWAYMPWAKSVLKSRIVSLTADLIFQFFVGEAWANDELYFGSLRNINMYIVFTSSFFPYFWPHQVQTCANMTMENVKLS